MRYFADPNRNEYWSHNEVSHETRWHTCKYPDGTIMDLTLHDLIEAATSLPIGDGELTTNQAQDIHASWIVPVAFTNLPAPVTPPEVEGLVTAMEAALTHLLDPIPSHPMRNKCFSAMSEARRELETALATYRARLAPPPAPSVTGGGT